MQRFKNILLVVNDDTNGQIALEHAIALSKRNQARLTVINPIEEVPRDVGLLAGADTAASLHQQVLAEHNQYLEQYVMPIREEGIKVTTKVLSGAPFLDIIREVLRNEHDLVMITAEGKAGLREMLFGSTTMHLMRKCPCPVWVFKPTQPKSYTRILAAVDPADHLDETSHNLNVKIMDLATSLARLEHSELHVIHTWTMYAESLLRSGRTKIPPTELNRLLAETEEMHHIWLDQLLEPYGLENLNHQIHLLKGSASTLIPELAREKEVDLIVMGTISRTGITGLLIGNTAENVLRQVDCSVLTVKPDGFVTSVKLNGE